MTVEIIASKSKIFSTGSRTDEMDSINMMQSRSANLAELLSTENSLFIKSYGAGGIATASFRGTEARHTAVLWNGFSINSPSLGLCDLSLAPAFFFNRVTIEHGSSSSLNGTSSLGGTIELTNEASFKKETKISVFHEASTINSYNSQLNLITGSGKFTSHSNLFYENDKNNFSFQNFFLSGSPVQKQKHSQLVNYGIMQSFYFKINPSSEISTGIWYQATHREIPPLMISAESKAEQRDSIIRMFGAFKKSFKRSAFTIRAACFDEYELYTDPVPQIYSVYKTKSLKGESEFRYYIVPKLLINTGVSYNGYRAAFKEYNETIYKNTYAAFAGIKYLFNKNLEAEITARKEFSGGTEPPVTPSAGVEKRFFNNRMTLKLRGGKNFNLPSLNDLYWKPGGNILLKPESAWTYETGIEIFSGKNKNMHSQFTFYSMHVNDWIQWQPTISDYAPINLKKVHARGIEAEINYKFKISHTNISVNGNYSFTHSANSQTENDLENEINGKQLIYIPEHLASLKFLISFTRFTLSFSHTYTGIRYTTEDNSDWLPSYLISNARVEKNFVLKNFSVNLFFTTHNISNEQYQVIAYRAMPGRHFSFGTNITFKINK